jgi:hypothetical protein
MNTAYERQIIARYERELSGGQQKNLGPALMVGAVVVGLTGLAALGVWLLLTGTGVL